MTYNFKTERGFITDVISRTRGRIPHRRSIQENGRRLFLHQRMENTPPATIMIIPTSIQRHKGKMIPNKNIVTGPVSWCSPTYLSQLILHSATSLPQRLFQRHNIPDFGEDYKTADSICATADIISPYPITLTLPSGRDLHKGALGECRTYLLHETLSVQR